MKSIVQFIKESLNVDEGFIYQYPYIRVVIAPHADDRTLDRNIRSYNIEELISKAYLKIDKAIQNKALSIGSEFIIRDRDSNLTLPCVLEIDNTKIFKKFIRQNGVKQDYLKLTIKTCIIKKDFKNYKSDYIIDIY